MENARETSKEGIRKRRTTGKTNRKKERKGTNRNVGIRKRTEKNKKVQERERKEECNGSKHVKGKRRESDKIKWDIEGSVTEGKKGVKRVCDV